MKKLKSFALSILAITVFIGIFGSYAKADSNSGLTGVTSSYASSVISGSSGVSSSGIAGLRTTISGTPTVRLLGASPSTYEVSPSGKIYYYNGTYENALGGMTRAVEAVASWEHISGKLSVYTSVPHDGGGSSTTRPTSYYKNFYNISASTKYSVTGGESGGFAVGYGSSARHLYDEKLSYGTGAGAYSLPTPAVLGWTFDGFYTEESFNQGTSVILNDNFYYNKVNPDAMPSSGGNSADATGIKLSNNTYYRFNNNNPKDTKAGVADAVAFGRWTPQTATLTLTYTIPDDVSSSVNSIITDGTAGWSVSTQGSTLTMIKTMTYDSSIGEVPIPQMNGYVFKGWVVQPKSGVYYFTEYGSSNDSYSYSTYGNVKNDTGSSYINTNNTNTAFETGMLLTATANKYGYDTPTVNVDTKYRWNNNNPSAYSAANVTAVAVFEKQTSTVVLDFTGNLPTDVRFRPSHYMQLGDTTGWTAGTNGVPMHGNSTDFNDGYSKKTTDTNNVNIYYYKTLGYDDKITTNDKLPVPSLEGWKFLGWKIYASYDDHYSSQDYDATLVETSEHPIGRRGNAISYGRYDENGKSINTVNNTIPGDLLYEWEITYRNDSNSHEGSGYAHGYSRRNMKFQALYSTADNRANWRCAYTNSNLGMYCNTSFQASTFVSYEDGVLLEHGSQSQLNSDYILLHPWTTLGDSNKIPSLNPIGNGYIGGYEGTSASVHDYRYFRWFDLYGNIVPVTFEAIWEPMGGYSADISLNESSHSDDALIYWRFERPVDGNRQYLDTASSSVVDEKTYGLGGYGNRRMLNYRNTLNEINVTDKVSGYYCVKPIYDAPLSAARVFETFDDARYWDKPYSYASPGGKAYTWVDEKQFNDSSFVSCKHLSTGLPEPFIEGWYFNNWTLDNSASSGYVSANVIADYRDKTAGEDGNSVIISKDTKWVYNYAGTPSDGYNVRANFSQGIYTVAYVPYTATSGDTTIVAYLYDHIYKYPNNTGTTFDGLRGDYGQLVSDNTLNLSESHTIQYMSDNVLVDTDTETYTFKGWYLNDNAHRESGVLGAYINRFDAKPYSSAPTSYFPIYWDYRYNYTDSRLRLWDDSPVYNMYYATEGSLKGTSNWRFYMLRSNPSSLGSVKRFIGANTSNYSDLSYSDSRILWGMLPDSELVNITSVTYQDIHTPEVQMVPIFDSDGFTLPNVSKDGSMFTGWYDFVQEQSYNQEKDNDATGEYDDSVDYLIDSYGTYYGLSGAYVSGAYRGSRHGILFYGGDPALDTSGKNLPDGRYSAGYLTDSTGRHKDIILYAWWNKAPIFVDLWDMIFYEGQQVTMKDLLSTTTAIDYEADYYNEAVKRLYNIQNYTDITDVYDLIYVGEPHADGANDENPDAGAVENTDPNVDEPEFDESAYASGEVVAFDMDGKHYIYRLKSGWTRYVGTFSMDGTEIVLYSNGDGRKFMSPQDKKIYQQYLESSNLVVDMYQIKYNTALGREYAKGNEQTVNFWSSMDTDTVKILPDDIGDTYSQNTDFYRNSNNLIYKDKLHTFLSTGTTRIVKTGDEKNWKGTFGVTFIVTDDGLSLVWSSEDHSGSYPSIKDPMGVRCALTYTRLGEIRYNDYPVISNYNNITSYDNDVFKSVSGLEDWLTSNQFALDKEDCTTNIPWWYKQDTQKALKDTLRVVGVNSVTFDPTFEAEHPAICNAVRAKLASIHGVTSGHSNDIVYIVSLYNDAIKFVDKGKTFNSSYVASRIMNMQIQYNCTDQWGKMATYDDIPSRCIEYTTTTYTPPEKDTTTNIDFEYTDKTFTTSYDNSNTDKDVTHTDSKYYPDGKSWNYVEQATNPENDPHVTPTDPATETGNPFKPIGSGSSDTQPPINYTPWEHPEVGTIPETSNTVIIINPATDYSMYAANIRESIRFINKYYLGTLGDTSYWGSFGKDTLYDVLKLGESVNNGDISISSPQSSGIYTQTDESGNSKYDKSINIKVYDYTNQ